MNIVSLHSHKGGTGKTTIAIGVAAILSQEKDRKVCLVEADIVGAGLEYSININPTGRYLNHFLLPLWSKESKNSRTIEEEVGEMLLDTDINNLYVISCTPLPDVKDKSIALEHQESVRGGLEKGVRDLIISLERDYSFDYCVFDCSPGLAGMSASVLRTTTINNGIAIFVATPDRSHIIGFLQDLEVFQKQEVINSEKIILVINKVPSELEKKFSDLNELPRSIERDTILINRYETFLSDYVKKLFKHYQHILHNTKINQQFYLAGSEGRILISDIKQTNIPLLVDMIEDIVRG